ncbi:uncharacterized protein ASCRUDRAFT_74477 [Ascoidea rubescens DSM 1968]|uniref:Uncharacterized protein n=1 Tax=Ascoidea rubescens DSM 1968 TaxID=1344418 RepID=A0A1D2VN86_9ASCO|nr:hypothetical protein ASCRUDRAFT_74477 [Ascoidea rubescens DSM 1968]ODV63081.1 hypothetical protein ASCRUDRAFT_74477 [Ascoidea rubescens DSM 1968]
MASLPKQLQSKFIDNDDGYTLDKTKIINNGDDSIMDSMNDVGNMSNKINPTTTDLNDLIGNSNLNHASVPRYSTTKPLNFYSQQFIDSQSLDPHFQTIYNNYTYFPDGIDNQLDNYNRNSAQSFNDKYSFNYSTAPNISDAIACDNSNNYVSGDYYDNYDNTDIYNNDGHINGLYNYNDALYKTSDEQIKEVVMSSIQMAYDNDAALTSEFSLYQYSYCGINNPNNPIYVDTNNKGICGDQIDQHLDINNLNTGNYIGLCKNSNITGDEALKNNFKFQFDIIEDQNGNISYGDLLSSSQMEKSPFESELDNFVDTYPYSNSKDWIDNPNNDGSIYAGYDDANDRCNCNEIKHGNKYVTDMQTTESFQNKQINEEVNNSKKDVSYSDFASTCLNSDRDLEEALMSMGNRQIYS